ncbi:MAG: SDR family oxidoreductase [Phycisphaerales bacterium]|nr:SDR family oxidoreductase [Phycisphaerales bacterium]
MNDGGAILLTGATGFVGHVLLAELLRRGHACIALVNRPDCAGPQLTRLLADLDIDAEAARRAGQFHLLAGRLPDPLPATTGVPVRCVVHAAACTRFDPDAAGEPMRTNAEGTRRLLEWMSTHEIRNLHLVSTAFVCGRTSVSPEQPLATPPQFHNAYEHSKWLAEVAARQWQQADARRHCTIHRPSIVVGDHTTGRTTRFSGLYLMFRAADILSRIVGARPEDRAHVPLRIACRPDDRVNIIPVDHVAATMADIIEHPDLQGRIYHHVHPDPPTNAEIRTAIEAAFDLAGGVFVDPDTVAEHDLNDIERSFNNAIRVIRPYLTDAVTFRRANVAAVEDRFARTCPRWDGDAFRRLIDFAAAARFGRSPARDAVAPAPLAEAHPCAVYFEQYLPHRVADSRIARLAALTTTVRFAITGVPDGEWVCRFDAGQLVEVRRGCNGLREDFTYRTGLDGFWDVVTARVDPQQVFLEGRAELSGDIEQALKMGVILREFNLEHPWQPEGEGHD